MDTAANAAPGRPVGGSSTGALGKRHLPLWMAGRASGPGSGLSSASTWSVSLRGLPSRASVSSPLHWAGLNRRPSWCGSLSPQHRQGLSVNGQPARDLGPPQIRPLKKPSFPPCHPLKDNFRKCQVRREVRNSSLGWEEKALKAALRPDLGGAGHNARS